MSRGCHLHALIMNTNFRHAIGHQSQEQEHKFMDLIPEHGWAPSQFVSRPQFLRKERTPFKPHNPIQKAEHRTSYGAWCWCQGVGSANHRPPVLNDLFALPGLVQRMVWTQPGHFSRLKLKHCLRQLFYSSIDFCGVTFMPSQEPILLVARNSLTSRSEQTQRQGTLITSWAQGWKAWAQIIVMLSCTVHQHQ